MQKEKNIFKNIMESVKSSNRKNSIERSEIIEGDIGSRIERFGYAKESPNFIDQVYDDSRVNLIKSYISDDRMCVTEDSSGQQIEYSEYASLRALNEFLIEESGDVSLSVDLRKRADLISNNLNFIGEKEFKEATRGLSEYYKNWLQSDPEYQLLLMTMSETGGNNTSFSVKSDVYMLDEILSNFSEAERKAYSGRIVRNIDQVSVTPDKLKAVIIDDWSISGEQMRYVQYLHNENNQLSYKPEINLIIARPQFIKKGFNYDSFGTDLSDERERFVVKSYFATKEPEPSDGSFDYEKAMPITGYYSSVDYGFEVEINKMVKASNKNLVMPPLTNIIRPYREPDYNPVNIARFFK